MGFEYDLSAEKLKKIPANRIIFATPTGGVMEWLVLSSWCRSQGLGSILVTNSKRIFFFTRLKHYLQLVFARKKYIEFFLSDITGPRLLICPSSERKKLFSPTKVETLLSGLYKAAVQSPGDDFVIVPTVIIWRKHVRGGARTLSEYFFGLASRPNFFGKLWYLARRRFDSLVRGLEPLHVSAKSKASLSDSDEGEAMAVAKSTRRKILIRHNEEMRVMLGPLYHSVHSVKESVIHDPGIQKTIERLAADGAEDKKKLMQRAYKILSEIAANYRYRFIEVMYVVLSWIFTRVFEGLDVDAKQIQRVRELMKRKPVVLIPCHRSHMDYLVMPYVMFLSDMVTPHVVAGINLAFWPIGGFLRMGGAFFIRRSFRGDVLYRECLNKYIEFLIKNRYIVEFFIEGTRSRSGKMLPPAYGILKMVLAPYHSQVCEDVALVPISIVYDEVPEQKSYSKELGGAEKVKESAGALLESRKITRRNIGKVYVRFAPEITASQTTPPSPEETEEVNLALQKTAFLVCKRINEVTPVTPKSLVASVLLAGRVNALSFEDIARLSSMLSDYVEQSGYSLSLTNKEQFDVNIEKAIKSLQHGGMVNANSTVPRTFFCENKRRMVLNYYKNNGMHCFVSPAITMLAIFRCQPTEGVAKHRTELDEIIERTLELRNILKFEFFFDPRKEFVAEMIRNLSFFFGKSEEQLRSDGVYIKDLEQKFEKWEDVSVYLGLLGDLFEASWTLLEFFREFRGEDMDKKSLIKRVIQMAEVRALQGKISFPESMSVQTYSNSLLLLNNLEVIELKKVTDKTVVHFLGWNEKCEKLCEEYAGYVALTDEPPRVMIYPETGLGTF